MIAFQYSLYVLLAVTSIFSVYNSVKSRRTDNRRLAGIYAARTNICMGIMLLIIAVVQLFLFSGSSIRVVIGAVIMLLGLFNLFAGIRNHSTFTALKE